MPVSRSSGILATAAVVVLASASSPAVPSVAAGEQICVAEGGCVPVPVHATTEPCDQRPFSSACGCVGVGDQPSGTGLRSCGIPVEPPCRGQSIADCACKDVRGTAACGQPVPACEDVAGDACGCVTPSATPSGPGLPRDVCGIPTQPCAVAPAVCECVQATATASALVPRAICGVPVDPCRSAGEACECIERHDAPAGGGVVVPTTVCGRPITIECDSDECRCVTETATYLPPSPSAGDPVTLLGPAACIPADECGHTSTGFLPAEPAYPAFGEAWHRKEDGFSTWTLKAPTHIVLAGENHGNDCNLPHPVPYGPDHGYWDPSKGTGSHLKAHYEPWGDHDCHLHHDEVGDDYAYRDAGGFSVRFVLHKWKGLLTDPFTLTEGQLGSSTMVAYHDTVFARESWPRKEYREAAMTGDDMLLRTCEAAALADQAFRRTQAELRWGTGIPSPIESTTQSAYSTACYATEALPLASSVPVEVCAKSRSQVYTKIDKVWMFVSTSEVLDGEGHMVIA